VFGSWRLGEAAAHPDTQAFAMFGFVFAAPVLLVMLLSLMRLPAAIGILMSEAFAIRSFVFHAGNGAVSALIGWNLFGYIDDSGIPLNEPLPVIAAWPEASPIGRSRGSARASGNRYFAAPPARCCRRPHIRRKSVNKSALPYGARSFRGRMQAITKADARMKANSIGRMALLIAVGAMLAACDRCGNWWSPLQDQAQIEVCREQPPRPQ
jgi:hypothetical protein